MNWLKQNPVIAAIAVAALLGTIGSGFLAIEGVARHEQAVMDLTSQVSTLRNLQSKKPYPNPENLKAIQDSLTAYEKAIQNLVMELNNKEGKPREEEGKPVKEITPQLFQDDLRQAVNDLQNEAKKNRVTLPEKFFLGFEEYKTQLPTQDEVKKLNREFQAIKGLVNSLLPLGISSIDTLERIPAAKPPAPAPDPKATPQKTDTAAPTPIPFDSFLLGITAPQNSFIKAFDKIPDSTGFLVVRSMTIQNTNPEPPPKNPPDKPGVPKPGSPSPESLPMIFGSEMVKTTLIFEVPDFPETLPSLPTPTPSPTPKK